MHRRDLLLTLPAALFLISASPRIRPENDVFAAEKVATDFCKGYLQTIAAQGDTKTYVLGSTLVTPAFKKAYELHLKKKTSGTRDPILSGLDFSNGILRWKYTSSTRVPNMSAVSFCRADDPQYYFTVFVLYSSGQWRVDGTKDLHNKVNPNR